MVARVQAPGQRGQFENGNFTISDKDFIFTTTKVVKFHNLLIFF